MKCGHDKATKLLKELVNAGLIRRHKRGRGLPTHIFVLAFCDQDNPHSRPPKFGHHESDLSAANNTSSINSDINKNILHGYFAALWEAYPAYQQRNRVRAFAMFRTVIQSEEDAKLALANFQLWRNSSQWAADGGKYVPYLENWFGRGVWRTEPRKTTAVYGCSEELGDDELEAIRRVLAEELEQ